MSPAWEVMPGVPPAGHVTGRGYWHPGRIDGCVKCEPPRPRVFVVKCSDIERCPIKSLHPQHYQDDGTCRCE